MIEQALPDKYNSSKSNLLLQAESVDVSKLGDVVQHLIKVSDWVYEAGTVLQGGMKRAALELDGSVTSLFNRLIRHCNNSQLTAEAGLIAMCQQSQEFKAGLLIQANSANKLHAHLLLEKFQLRWDKDGKPRMAPEVDRRASSNGRLSEPDPLSEKLIDCHFEALRRQAVPAKLALGQAKSTAVMAINAEKLSKKLGLSVSPIELEFIEALLTTGVEIVDSILSSLAERSEDSFEELVHLVFQKRAELGLGSLDKGDNMAIAIFTIFNELLPSERVNLDYVKNDLKGNYWLKPHVKTDLSFVSFEAQMYQNLLDEFGLGIDFKPHSNSEPRVKLYHLQKLSEDGRRYGPELKAYQNNEFRERFMPLVTEMVLSGGNRAVQAELRSHFTAVRKELLSMAQNNKLISFLEYYRIKYNGAPQIAHDLALRQLLRIGLDKGTELVFAAILNHPVMSEMGVTDLHREHTRISAEDFAIDPGKISPSIHWSTGWEDFWKYHAFAVATQLIKQRRNQIYLAEMLYHRLSDENP